MGLMDTIINVIFFSLFQVHRLKPIFHLAFLGRVGVNNANDFALGTFQIFFYNTRNIKFLKSVCIITKQDLKYASFLITNLYRI